jgi:enamine deaminase RidA (YjgF/YER057c/UK114 family)
MSGMIDARLEELGIELPQPSAAAANYVPYVVSGNQVFVSGQVPVGPNGLEFQGKVGRDVTAEDAQAAARLCAINIVAQVKAACDGDLDKVVRVVKLGGFVNGSPDFDQHPAVINGASDLLVEIFGDKGRHARFAVGAGNLPFNVAVEIDAIVEIA